MKMTGLWIKYKAINSSGNLINGECFADSIIDAEMKLQEKGYLVVALKKSLWFTEFFFTHQVSTKDMALMVYEIRQLYCCGMPIIECLSLVAENLEDQRLSALMNDLAYNISEGASLSQAMARHEGTIKSFMINMVRLGEQSGRLELVLEQLESMLKWQLETYEAIKKELIYPILVAVVVALCIQFQMMYLVPKLSSFFQQLNIPMPTSAQILIVISSFLNDHFMALLIGISACFTVVMLSYRKSQAIRYQLDKLLLKTVYIGPVIRNLALARVVKGFSILHASGMPVIEATLECQTLTQNSCIRLALKEIHQRISTGATLGLAFSQHTIFPTLLIRMVQAGELAGKLNQTLCYSVEHLESTALATVEKLQKTLAPVMLLLLGGIMIWMVVAIIAPIYTNLIDQAVF